MAQQIKLTEQVAGVLPVSNGGTGVSSVGTSGNVLTSNGTIWVSSAPSGGGVSDTAYGAGWNGDTTSAPSKNAVYDKIESMGTAAPLEIRIRIPGEMVADTSNYQGVFWRNTTGATITISNVKIGVAIAAAGSGAAAAFNVYKSSGTAVDGINTNAVNLFTSAVDLGTANNDDTNVPNTTTVEDGRWVSLRVTSSAGATNKASDAEIIIAYS